jgi:carbonic anhydrase
MGWLAWIPLLFLLGLTEASAARWVGIAEGAARAIYLDTEGVQHEGATVRAWTREVYTEEQRSPHTGVLYYWGELKPEFAACGEGKRQSPIDIRDGARLDLEPIKFDYKPSTLRIIDNGHTVQVNYAEGSSITVSGVRYDLKQFHFHNPSEERVEGKIYDMIAHVVHLSADGRLAVVAVLMEAGLPNPFIASLWPHLPLESGREISLPEVVVDINNLLPESRNYYAYMGSLTTPPCTEGVLWLVMKNPVSVASEQVGIFGKTYSMNARPVQPANGRLIKESL